MGSRRRSAFTRSYCLVSSFSSARRFFRLVSHWSRETIGGCGIVLVVVCGCGIVLVAIYGLSFDPVQLLRCPERHVSNLIRQYVAVMNFVLCEDQAVRGC